MIKQACLALSLCGLASAADAQDPLKGLWFVGAAAGEGPAGYAGFVQSLPGARLGDGLAVRASVAGGQYEYAGGTGTIEASYGAGQLALVRQFSGPWGWANASIGGTYGHTRLSPDDPGNKLRGGSVDVVAGFDGAFDGPRWRLGWYGAYGALNQTYQGQLSLGRKLGDRMRIGVEGGILGDPSYTRGSAGAFVGVALPNRKAAPPGLMRRSGSAGCFDPERIGP
jgi:hypothetical protein